LCKPILGQVTKANAKEQAIYNPVMDFEEFQEEMEDDGAEAW